MNICLKDIYLIILSLIVLYLLYSKLYYNNEPFQNTTTGYPADIEAIRNLSSIAAKLMAGGLTVPGQLTVNTDHHIPIIAQSNTDSHILLKTKNDANKDVYLINRDGHFRLHSSGVGDMFGVNKDGHHYIRHTGDNVINIDGDGNNPYFSLGKSGTWNEKKLYIQNVGADTTNPMFRIGVHGVRSLMDMSKDTGVYWGRKDGRNTHFDWTDGNNYIRGDTIIDGNTTINGKFCIGGTCINESHLQMLTGQKAMTFYHTSGGNDHGTHKYIHVDRDRHLVTWHNQASYFVLGKE